MAAEMKKISIVHPSFKRAHIALACYFEWVGKCSDTNNIEYILCLSEHDNTLPEYLDIFKDTSTTLVVLPTSIINGLVNQTNEGAKHAKGNIIIASSDDFLCPKNWDAELLGLLANKEDYIVKTQDGIQDWLITIPIMDRKYYDRFGYIFYPEYKHLFCDTDLTHVADRLGRKITLPMFFEHKHWCVGKAVKDEVNFMIDTTVEAGQLLFWEREKNNFGL